MTQSSVGERSDPRLRSAHQPRCCDRRSRVISTRTHKKRVTITVQAKQKVNWRLEEKARETRSWILVPLLGNEEGAESPILWAWASKSPPPCTKYGGIPPKRGSSPELGGLPSLALRIKYRGSSQSTPLTLGTPPLTSAPAANTVLLPPSASFPISISPTRPSSSRVVLALSLLQLDTDYYRLFFFLCISRRPETSRNCPHFSLDP